MLFPAALIEGPTIMMSSGLLVRLGYLSLLPVYFCLVFGDLTGDILWYGVGYFFGHRFIRRLGHYFGITEEHVATVTRIFHRHKKPILFVSKITAGFGFSLATLISAGIVRIPLRSFVIFNFLGELVWTGMLMSVGYFFGNAYIHISSIAGKVSLCILAGIIAVCIILISKYIKRKATQTL